MEASCSRRAFPSAVVVVLNSMLDHESPFRILAVQRLQEQFGDLLSVQAQITEFEDSLLGTIFEFIWIFRPEDHRKWEQTARAAYHFLEKAFNESNPKGVAAVFLKTTEQLSVAINELHVAKQEVRDEPTTGPAAIRKVLSLYKMIVEGPYRLILAPIAYSFGKVMRNAHPAFTPDSEGKIALSALTQIERLSVLPQSAMRTGLNTHVRNAYAHEHYRPMDNDMVEIWDVSPSSGEISWGPEIWPLTKLRDLSVELEQTIYAFLLALTIFSMNKRTVMTGRGWMVGGKLRKLSSMELEPILRYHAARLQFRFQSFHRTDTAVEVSMRLQLPGISQEEEILVGMNKGGRRFKVKVEWVDVPLIEQVLGFLQRCERDVYGYEVLTLHVRDQEDRNLGSVSIPVSNLAQLKGPNQVPVAAARGLLTVDTIPNATMPYEIRHQAVER